MRRPAFRRWIKRQLLEIAGASSFSLRKLAASAQNDKPRLVEPLLLYAAGMGQVNRLFSFVYKEDIRVSYENVISIINGVDLEEASLDGQLDDCLPREYSKLLTSFRVSYNRPESIKESKRMRWERSRKLQLEKGVSTAEIYNSLGLNAGNVNAYLKHGDLDKVSLQNATDIMDYLFQYKFCQNDSK